MYKKDVTYENFLGETKTKTLYFNLSRKDLLNIVARYDHNEGGAEKFLRGVFNSGDAGKIMPVLEDIILNAYGWPTEDGEGFIKPKGDALEQFRNSAAFDEFYYWLFDPNAVDSDGVGKNLSEFLEKIMPKIPVEEKKQLPPGA